jgi:hypothetical protein
MEVVCKESEGVNAVASALVSKRTPGAGCAVVRLDKLGSVPSLSITVGVAGLRQAMPHHNSYIAHANTLLQMVVDGAFAEAHARAEPSWIALEEWCTFLSPLNIRDVSLPIQQGNTVHHTAIGGGAPTAVGTTWHFTTTWKGCTARGEPKLVGMWVKPFKTKGGYPLKEAPAASAVECTDR